MIEINLLPWRAERRKKHEARFFMQLALSFLLAVAAVLVWSYWMTTRIDNQNTRNTYLKKQIVLVDKKIERIKHLEKMRDDLLKRKSVIEQLQYGRYQAVHLFDALVETIPESVQLISVSQSGNAISIEGVAQSNASVAQYMVALASSRWFAQPRLNSIVNRHDQSHTPYSFSLALTLKDPQDNKAKPAKKPVSSHENEVSSVLNQPVALFANGYLVFDPECTVMGMGKQSVEKEVAA